MAEPIGRLFVAVDADITRAMNSLKVLDDRAIKVAQHFREMGSSGGGLDKTAQASQRAATAAGKLGTESKKAADGVKKIGSAAGGAGRPLNQLQTSMYRLSQSFINMRYGNPIGTIVGLTQSLGGMAGAAGSAGKSMGVFAGGLAIGVGAVVIATVAVGGAAAMLAKVGLQAAASLETLRIQFETLLPPAQKAADEIQFIQALGQQSIMPTEQIMEADRALLSFGVNAQGTRWHLVKMMADWGSATGMTTSQFQNLGYAIGQINSQGRATAQEIRQLAQANIPVSELARHLGVSTDQFKKMVEAGQMTSDKLLPALVAIGEGASEGAGKAADSVNGMIANIKDAIQFKLASAFTGLLEQFKPVIAWIQDFINAFDFAPIAAAFGNLGTYISEIFGDVDANAGNSAMNIADTLGNILNFFAGYVKKLLQFYQAIINTVVTVWQAVVGTVSVAMGFIVDKMATIVGWVATVGEALGMSWGESMRSAEQSMVGFANVAHDAAMSAYTSMSSAANAAGAAWNDVFTDWDFKGIPKAAITTSSMPKIPEMTFDPPPGLDDKGGKGKKKTDDLIARLKKLAETISALQDLTRRPFGEDSFIQKEFGDISSADKIVSAFDKTKKAVVDFYDASRAVASKAGKSLLDKRQAVTLRDLSKQTQTLVNLANENKRLSKELADWRRDEGLRVQGDIDALKRQYEGYNDARGYAIKGLIENAQDALDAATQAYDDANAKLQDLIASRDEFLAGIRDSARSFVNALSVSSEMVQEYTRLDDVGSFMINEKQKSASLKEQMASRLETVKKFAENMKILMAQGLNGQLLQDLVNAGPEAAGDAMQELVNGGQASIDEINQIQSELDKVIGGIQGSASAAWFDPAINIQQGVVNQLATQKAVAEQALKDAQAAYNMRLAQLEAYQKSVEDGTDAHSVALTDRIKANETAAQEIADGMQAKLAWLTDPKNKKNTDVLGNAAIAGFIAGMKSQRQAAIDAAQSIANAVSNTIANAFKIKSPSRLMMQYGAYITEGLAIGMESALPKVEAASIRVAQASLPSLSDTAQAAPTVIVKIGDQELRDIIDVQVDRSDARSSAYVMTGRRL